MLTFLPEDHETIIQQLGTIEIPEGVFEEYRLRIKMYHASGSSGTLGPLAILDMLRHLGLKPLRIVDEPKATDWRLEETGQRVVVTDDEGKNFNGVFSGYLGMGQLEVLVDGETMTRDFQSRQVRIADSLESIEKKAGDDVDAAAEQKTAAVSGEVNWNAVLPNTAVIVDSDGEIRSGFFQGSDDGRLLVTLSESQEKVICSSEQVALEETV
ncbi:MAG: hypothetical protein AAGB04_00105 [Pseudomonadota bacterium]